MIVLGILGWVLAVIFFAAAWQLLNWLGEAEDLIEASPLRQRYTRRSPARGTLGP